jgi:hypothetical protein
MRKALRTEGFSLAEIPREVVALAPKFAIKSSTDSSMGAELDALSFSMKEKDLASAEAGKRLASPYHYRLYFALSAPKGAPQNDDFSALRYALRTAGEEASDLLQGWFDGPTFYDGTTKGREVLKRIERQPFENLDHNEAKGFIAALANVMDQCAESKWTMHDRPDDWYYAGKILHHLSISDHLFGYRFEIESAFKGGKAISWLAYILRWDLLVKTTARVDEYLPAGVVLQTACDAFNSRLDDMAWQEVFETKRPLFLLECWLLLGHGDKARALFNEGTKSDEDFVSLLEAMVEPVDHPNRGRVSAVRHSVLTVVIDPEAAKKRLGQIVKDRRLLSNRSKSILKSIRLGADMVVR